MFRGMGNLLTVAAAIFVSLFLVSPVLAQQISNDTLITVNVYSDSSADGSQQSDTESVLAGWSLQFYDDQNSLTSSVLSQDVQDGQYTLDPLANYLCIMPDTNWIQTFPSQTMQHPDNSTWFCHDLEQDIVFNFGVFLINDDGQGEVEDNPDIINQFPEKDPVEPNPVEEVEQIGQVLGATDNGSVLAETGAATYLSLAGLAITILAIHVSTRTSIYRK